MGIFRNNNVCELVNFYEFFCKEYNLVEEGRDIFIFREIVKLRNSVCHNGKLLCDLGSKDNEYPLAYKIIKFLKESGINKETRINKLSNSRIRQITYTLYMFNEIVTSKGVKENVKEDIINLFYGE